MPRALSMALERSRPKTSIGSSTFSSTVRQGNSTEVWNITPTSRRGPLTLRPPTVISPVLGSSRPPMSFRSVDLPQPLGPTKETNSPGWISTLTPRSASSPDGKTLLTARRPRAAGPAGLGGRRQVALWRSVGGGPGEQPRALIGREGPLVQGLDAPHHGVLIVHRLPHVAMHRTADGAGHVHIERQHELREAPVVVLGAGVAPRADEQAVVGLEHADLRAAVARLDLLLQRDLAQVP